MKTVTVSYHTVIYISFLTESLKYPVGFNLRGGSTKENPIIQSDMPEEKVLLPSWTFIGPRWSRYVVSEMKAARYRALLEESQSSPITFISIRLIAYFLNSRNKLREKWFKHITKNGNKYRPIFNKTLIQNPEIKDGILKLFESINLLLLKWQYYRAY